MEEVVSPFDQRYEPPPEAKSVSGEPGQSTVELALTPAVGKEFCTTTTDAVVVPHALVAVTVYVPAVLIEIEDALLPVDQLKVLGEVAVSVKLLPWQKEAFPAGDKVTAGAGSCVSVTDAVDEPQTLLTVSVYVVA